MEPRTTTIDARASVIEREALAAVAKYYRRNPSEQLRELVREKCRELGLWDDLVRETKFKSTR